MPDGCPRPARATRRLPAAPATTTTLPQLQLAIGAGSAPLPLELVGLVLVGLLRSYSPRDLGALALLRSIAEAFVSALLPGASAPRPMELARALGLRVFRSPREAMAGTADRSAWTADDDDSLDLLVADDLSPAAARDEVVRALGVAVLVRVGMPPSVAKGASLERDVGVHRASLALAGFLLVPRALVDEALPAGGESHVSDAELDRAFAELQTRTHAGGELLGETLSEHLSLRHGHQFWHLAEFQLDLEAA